MPYVDRAEIVASIKFVDLVIPEVSWEQKVEDISTHDVDLFVIGDDWKGKFDFLQAHCSVEYFTRTTNISSTQLKQMLAKIDLTEIEHLQSALRIMSSIITSIK